MVSQLSPFLNNRHILLYIGFFCSLFALASCGSQKRLADASQKVQTAKKIIDENNEKLAQIHAVADKKLDSAALDSTITAKIDQVIERLRVDLNKIAETVDAVELFSHKKSNFNERNYYSNTKQYIDRLDSFQKNNYTRDRIYQLLSEAVTMKAFSNYEMGAFFDPGAYKVPPTALQKLSTSFQPAVDSIILQSNKYADIKRKAYLVFVGYADAMPVNSGSALYSELSSYLKKIEQPSRQQLNEMLSNLRAGELLRNMKMLMLNNASKLSGYNKLSIDYVGYGRGEAIPFKNLSDYKADDDRRRVVVFYWSILPDIK